MARNRALFAEFGIRMAAIAIDFWLMLFAAQAMRDYIPGVESLVQKFNNWPIVTALLFVYFTLAWVSPLKATLAQALFGFRVVDQSGERLTLVRAAIRGAVLIGCIHAAYIAFETPPKVWLAPVALAAYVALYFAAFTRNRQALHDVLARSIVVNRGVTITSDHPPPSVIRKVIDAVVLIVPVYLLWNVAQIMNHKDMAYRTNYALNAVHDLKYAVEIFHLQFDRWPTEDDELGASRRFHYPDGGYYELEDNGVIRIRFEVRPELKYGSLVVSPVVGDEGITWDCHVEGNIKQTYLPAMCRD